MDFSPLVEGNKIANTVPFETVCKLLERVSSMDCANRKRTCISLFIQKWAARYRETSWNVDPIAGNLGSFFPVLRLLIPSADRTRPAYGVGESTMARFIIKAFGLSPKSSDAVRILTRRRTLLFKATAKEDLADIKIHEILDDLASSSSHGQKYEIIGCFARKATILELKWFVRIVSRRDLSLGVKVRTILGCLHPAAPSIWNVTQDLCVVCQRIAYIDPKLAPPDDFHCNYDSVELFTAFKPMLCSRANSVDEICTTYQQEFSGSIDNGLCVEVKYDGERVQLHKSGINYRFWSRSGREWSSSYGERGDSSKGSLTYRLHANGTTFASHVVDCILDGEMLAFDGLTNRFVTKATGNDVKRVGVDRQSDGGKNVLPCFIVFDVLYLNGQVIFCLIFLFLMNDGLCDLEFLSMVYAANTATLHHIILTQFTVAKKDDCLGAFFSRQTRISRCFDTWVQHGAEGLVAKALCTPYTPNGRAGAGWWKLKPDYVLGLCVDLDCLVVGAYASASAPACGTKFSTFLCAISDDGNSAETETKRRRLQSNNLSPPSFLTFCQVSCGLKRDQLERLNRCLASHWRQYDRRKINCDETEWLRVSGERPDFWLPPRHSLVLQIHAAEMIQSASYSAGFTLRFPRIVAIREDKTWENVSSISEIKKLYQDTKVEIESSAFVEVEFCLYISSRFSGPSTGLETKGDLEKAILKRSGKVVQNPGSDTTYIVADRITAKISNFIEATHRSIGRGKEGGYDIVSTEWLIQCIQTNRILPLRKDQVFAARPSTLLQLDESYDDTHSNYVDLVLPARLRAELFDQMSFRRLSTSEYIQLFKGCDFSDLALPLCGVSIILYGSVDASPQVKLMIADLRSLQATVHGPLTEFSTLLPERTGTVTHVVVVRFVLGRGSLHLRLNSYWYLPL
ncbi:unnamed protein product [Hydatigera taeniaeformis]|uniref:DNA ligase n=1 Tax=Hydatigena taeniaeformis TaxID=6205 RepID=A0A0R3WHK1_HYDTA|nr:unnamed protein product [Hydatigera taeniaeformis]